MQKTTTGAGRQRRRWYDDACGTAFALEMIGERWSILIIRELMFGPRRFNQLREDLATISASILTDRLKGLERARILQRRRLPPPASARVYELTEWGYQAEPIIVALGRWATRHPSHDPRLPLSAASLMLSLRAMFAPGAAADVAATFGFRLGEDGFVARIEGGRIALERREPEDVDLLFTAAPTTLAAAIYAGEPLEALEKTAALRFDGDRRLARRFVRLFRLPDKLPDESE